MGGRVTYDEYRYRQTDAILQPKAPRSASSAAWSSEVLRVTCHDCNTVGRIFRGYLLKELTEICKTPEDGLWLMVYCPWARHLIRSEPLLVHPLELFSLDLDATKGQEVIVRSMPVVHRPPRKGGNFLKAAMVKAASAKVKVIKVRPNVDLPAGVATVLDIEYQGESYGFPLNVTNHRMLCSLFGDEKAESFDSADIEGKTITLKKVMANNPRERKEVETLRIAG